MRCTNPKCTKFETRTPKPFFKELKKTSFGHAESTLKRFIEDVSERNSQTKRLSVGSINIDVIVYFSSTPAIEFDLCHGFFSSSVRSQQPSQSSVPQFRGYRCSPPCSRDLLQSSHQCIRPGTWVT